MLFPILLAIAALAIPLTGIAAQNNQALDPSNPAAESSGAPYESAFTGYRAWQDIKVSPVEGWRAANDEMARIGGHAGQIKEVLDEAPSATQKPMPVDTQTPTPAPPVHDMKNMKKGK